MKLYLCIVIFVIIPLLLTGIYLNNQFADLTLHKSSEIALQTLKQTRQNFDALVADTNDISVRLLSNELAQKFSKGNYDRTLEYDRIYRDLSSWLDDVVGSKTYYDSISISAGDAVIFQKGKLVPEVNAELSKKAVELRGKGFWSVDEGGISFYRAIMDFHAFGNMVAVEKFSIRENTVHQFYKDIHSYDGAEIYLVDPAGIVLSSSARNAIGKPLGQSDPIRRAMGMQEGYFSADIADVRHVVLAYEVAGTRWHLIQTIPENSFTLLKTTINLVLLLAIGLCIVFGILFSFIQHAYLIKPLGSLRKEMTKVKTGNFNIDLQTDMKDEIGEINQGFVRMTQQLKETINDVYISQIKQKEAELTALQAQINPHFLYNTLDSIRWLALKRKNYDVGEQIEALSEIFKHVLNKGEPFVSIAHEIDFLENYMFVQKAKYGDRIRLRIHADPELVKYKAPKLILQPLVENAILHGLEPNVEGGTVEISIEEDGNDVLLVVQDDGIGADEEAINRMLGSEEQAKNVFALKNIDDRIKLKYGPAYGIRFQSRPKHGVRVEIRIPRIL